MAEARTPRIRETREESKRQWTPPEALPAPNPQEGYAFRWIRISSNGDADPQNYSKRLREGWEPVKAKDHPEVHVPGNENGDIEFGGLILCKTPTEMIEQRNAYYNERSRREMDAVDNAYLREQDARMPMFTDRRTKVSFGDGT